MRVSLTFDTVKFTASKTVIIDGKKRRRQKTFWQTLNPYNRNEDGTEKTRRDIQRELIEEARKWKSEDGS